MNNNLVAFANADFSVEGKSSDKKNHFCFNCGGNSLTKNLANEEHIEKGHKVLKVHEIIEWDGFSYKTTEMQNLEVFDDSGIQVHWYGNGFDVCYILPKAGQKAIIHDKCLNCKIHIDKDALYCSMSCKLKCMMKGSHGLEAKNKRKEIELGGGSNQSVMNKAKKNDGESKGKKVLDSGAKNKRKEIEFGGGSNQSVTNKAKKNVGESKGKKVVDSGAKNKRKEIELGGGSNQSVTNKAKKNVGESKGKKVVDSGATNKRKEIELGGGSDQSVMNKAKKYVGESKAKKVVDSGAKNKRKEIQLGGGSEHSVIKKAKKMTVKKTTSLN